MRLTLTILSFLTASLLQIELKSFSTRKLSLQSGESMKSFLFLHRKILSGKLSMAMPKATVNKRRTFLSVPSKSDMESVRNLSDNGFYHTTLVSRRTRTLGRELQGFDSRANLTQIRRTPFTTQVRPARESPKQTAITTTQATSGNATFRFQGFPFATIVSTKNFDPLCHPLSCVNFHCPNLSTTLCCKCRP